jgi:RND family efflux transporter MFP subunit
MTKVGRKRFVPLIVLIILIGSGWIIFSRLQRHAVSTKRGDASRPVPVETAQIQLGPIELRRSFNGALEALAEFVVAPKVSGRVDKLFVNISDTVRRGQVVAELENGEYVQALAQAKADLVVAKANLAMSKSALAIANREFERTEKLLKRGIASDSEFDSAKAELLTKGAELEVAEAQVAKAEAALETANIRIGYTKVTASWSGGDDYRLVAERYLDEGQTVSANEKLLLIVELNPIVGVVYVTEKDYARLVPGQVVSLITDAYPGEEFSGRIDRIAPIFRKSTRQARVEMNIENQERRLKPGMFVRATVVLERVSEATIIPRQALTTRDGKTGVFLVSEDGRSVSWREVACGIQEGNWVQVEGEGMSGRVVTLGQQLIDEGSAITIANEPSDTVSHPREVPTE